MIQPFQKTCIKKPPAIQRTDRIGIAAPASPFDADRFYAGVDVLSGMGFDVVVRDDLFRQNGYLAGTDIHRLEMFHGLITDPAIKAVWCARGGYGSMRLLPHLDFRVIGGNPKPFIGSSDITAMLNVIAASAGVVTFHAPVITMLAGADRESLDAVMAALTEKRPLVVSADPPGVIVSGCATGPVIGGNLSILSHLLGTPYFPDFTGAIVFLEDVGEKPYRIDRMLTQMLFSGCLDHASGICLGTFHHCGEKEQVERVLRDRLASFSIPVMAGIPVGHGMPAYTLPIGAEACLDTDSGHLCYLESAVS